jgi:hypothetical protein
MSKKASELVQECRRQSESCLYTATSLFIWLRVLRSIRIAFIVSGLVCGTLASKLALLPNDPAVISTGWIALLAFLAGILPALYSALKFDSCLEQAIRLAAEFKNLQDRFRQTALFGVHQSVVQFETAFNQVMERMEQARRPSYTAPEWCFKIAQKKVQGGDYSFDVDAPVDNPP